MDPEDLALGVYLAWHRASQQLFVGIETYDDFLAEGQLGDRSMVMVDGDHSGGLYFFNDQELEGIYSIGEHLGGASDADLLADAELIPCAAS